jgi:hypothetical protein
MPVNKVFKIETTFIHKIPPDLPFQPTVGALSKGGINIPSLAKGGEGRFFKCKYYFETINKSLIFIFVLLTFFPCSGAQSQEISDQPEPQVFSNRDLENYMLQTYDKASGTGTNNSGTLEKDDIKRKAREIQEQDEQEHWCKKAAAYTKQIEKSKKNVRDSENALSELTNSLLAAGGRKRKSIEKEIDKTEQTLKMDKKRLREKEADLAELEGEAHRKGVPPGWLRCQFE